MTEIAFSHRGTAGTLRAGDVFLRPMSSGFADTGAHEMQEIVAAIERGTPWRREIEQRFGTTRRWLREIILSPKRRAFFPLLPEGVRRILDIGCGWGQMTLPLAAEGREVVAIEPGPHRLAFVQAAAAQDGVKDRIAFVGADYLDCQFAPVFDAILMIGVLEWAGAFHPAGEPRTAQRQFLRLARRQLAPGGVLVVGIENRLGAKYLLGAPDDHLGVPHIGCLPAGLADRRWRASTGAQLRCFTYSAEELREMLCEAGCSDIRFFGALPDYKLPEWIAPLDDGGRELADRLLAGPPVREHNGFDGSPLADELQERLHAFYLDAARHTAAHHFVPSFFVVAR